MASPDDRRKIALRLTIIQYGLTVAFAFLALAFWYLQVVQHQHFNELAENNHQRTLALRAPRGVIFDRKNRVLVENRDAFTISIVREHITDLTDLKDTVRQLADLTGSSASRILDAVRRHEAEPRYKPIVVVEDASLEQVAAVTAHRYELPAVIVERVPTRRYPADALAAHLFGYVGEASEEQVATDEVKVGDVVGKDGFEKVYNASLMGRDGERFVVVNSLGREIRTVDEVPPTEGKRIQLTIDLDVQRATEEAFKALGYNGAAVILDPRSGEVLSYVSLPTYDPNAFAAGIDPSTWKALNADSQRPLIDRAIRGRYSPGSTFKIAVATAALEEGVITPDFKVHCTGSATFYGRPFKCWKAGGHGTLDLEHAIEQSCNVYFYTLGNLVGIDRIHKWATLLGLGEKSGIDLPGEIQGLVPSTEWKRRTTGDRWYPGETISVAIGQGQVSVTPVSMAVYAATVANGRMRYVPHLVRAVDDGSGWEDREPPGGIPVDLKPETVAALHQALWLVVNAGGTGGNARIAGKDVAGKTGTAQVISIEGGRAAAGKTDMDLRDNGWFIFFAPRDNPEIAGAVFAEHALHGSEAARIARYAMETYFASKEGRPLPQFQPPPRPATATPATAVGQNPG